MCIRDSLAYGARAITAGGLMSLPKTVFPGGALVGCDAGYLNVSRIKGTHSAIKTGMLAAQAAFEAVSYTHLDVYKRQPIGRYGGALSSVRTDDLGAIPIRALLARNPHVDWAAVTDVLYGCANQAGEDNRNVAHMVSLLAGLPVEVPGATLNRLCGSGLDAVGSAARAIKSGEATLMIACLLYTSRCV